MKAVFQKKKKSSHSHIPEEMRPTCQSLGLHHPGGLTRTIIMFRSRYFSAQFPNVSPFFS